MLNQSSNFRMHSWLVIEKLLLMVEASLSRLGDFKSELNDGMIDSFIYKIM